MDTASAVLEPCRPDVHGLELFEDSRERVRMERWAPDARVELDADGGIEALVLDGVFTEGGETFERQSWLRLPPGLPLRAVAAPGGCRVWIKTGHLRHVDAP